MTNQTDSNLPAPSNRRKLLFGVGIFSIFSLFSFSRLNIFSRKKSVIACAPEKQTKTVRMLTQEGKLVEVEVSKLSTEKQKVTNQELQNWVKS